MKRIIRIATLLTVIALGIENVPGAEAFISQDDSAVSVNKKAKLSKNIGIRVDPKPLDLLWQNEPKSKPRQSPGGNTNFNQNDQVFLKLDLPRSGNNISPDNSQSDLSYFLQNDKEKEIFTCQKKLKQ